jgi:hypothetical protein
MPRVHTLGVSTILAIWSLLLVAIAIGVPLRPAVASTPPEASACTAPAHATVVHGVSEGTPRHARGTARLKANGVSQSFE